MNKRTIYTLLAVLRARSRSDLFEEWAAQPTLLTDDLEDQGATGSAVLSPVLNLQGASWDQDSGETAQVKDDFI